MRRPVRVLQLADDDSAGPGARGVRALRAAVDSGALSAVEDLTLSWRGALPSLDAPRLRTLFLDLAAPVAADPARLCLPQLRKLIVRVQGRDFGDGFPMHVLVGASLTALERLDLYDCEIRELPAGCLRLPALRLLTLEFNNAGFELDELEAAAEAGALPQLRVLDLSNCALPAVPVGALRLPALEELRLTGNHGIGDSLHAALVAAAPVLGRLQQLKAGGTGLRSFPALSLPALTHLRLLGNSMVLDDGVFDGLPALQTLDLAMCHLPGVPASLRRLGKLQRLSLHSNRALTLTAEDVAELRELQFLHVGHTSSFRGELERAVPAGCSVLD